MLWKMHAVLGGSVQEVVRREVCVQAANGRFSALLRVGVPLHCHRPQSGFPFLRHSLLSFLRSLIDVSSLACSYRDLSACAS
jgi:hypothetical protein